MDSLLQPAEEMDSLLGHVTKVFSRDQLITVKGFGNGSFLHITIEARLSLSSY